MTAAVAICKPLAHPARVEILRILEEAGLVTGEIEGPRTCYCVNKNAVTQLEKLFGKLFARDPHACRPAARRGLFAD